MRLEPGEPPWRSYCARSRRYSLRAKARQSKDAGQTRRFLALAAIYDGASRTEAALMLQIVQDWVFELNAGGPEALVDYRGPGPQPILSDAHRTALARAVEDGPIPAIHGVVRWRVIDLVQWLVDEFVVSVSKQTFSRELRQMGDRRLSARPRHHVQAAGAIEASNKTVIARLDAIGRTAGTGLGGVDFWFAEEARVGQKNRISRRCAKRGTRPSAPQDQRTASTYIFGAVCPATGAAADLVLPWCNTER